MQVENSLPAQVAVGGEIVRCESFDGMQELADMLSGAAVKEENAGYGGAGARAASAEQQTRLVEQQELHEDAWAAEEADMIKRSMVAQREAVTCTLTQHCPVVVCLRGADSIFGGTVLTLLPLVSCTSA